MKKTLVLCAALFAAAGTALCNAVVIVYDHVGAWLDPIKPLILTEPPAERRDLVEHGMPSQAAPTARTVKVTTDQRPWLDRFVRLQHQPAFG